MAIERGVPITMQRFSVSHPAAAALPREVLQDVISGKIVVMSAAWSEQRGRTETWVSEHWTQRGPDIWVVMSPRR